ncbi:hypothetical protein HZF02_32860 (plasmid) [Pseudomonas yamanorum]|nr:hypothetical protein HZF02_32860 [Pseudomonas yamanorum]
MAKATTPASGKPAKAPREPRKAAVTASDDVNQQEAGATAPVSLPVDPALAGDGSVEAKDDAEAPADDESDSGDNQAVQTPLKFVGRAFFPGMGVFPPDWKPAQTPEEEASVEVVQSSAWGLPEIAQFPAELTLVNNTRNILVVRPLNTRLTQFSTKTVQCPTARKYAAIGLELAARALRERWDSETGLQVKHDEDQD